MVTMEQVTKSTLDDARGNVANAVLWYGDAVRNYAVNSAQELGLLAGARRRDVERQLDKLVDAAKAYGTWHSRRPVGEPDTVVEDGSLVKTLDRVLDETLMLARTLGDHKNYAMVVKNLEYVQQLMPRVMRLDSGSTERDTKPLPFAVELRGDELVVTQHGYPVFRATVAGAG